MLMLDENFYNELIEFIEKHGHIQQQGVFPIAKNAEGNPYIGV